ncbi:VanZ family protein [Arcticibacter sp.]|uniref:VanZ family protein n=1 Tax=Arcticibacter sp. TaxID=1872630 RepID=UPI00388FF34F
MINNLKYQYLSFMWLVLVLILCNMHMDSVTDNQNAFFEGFDKLVHTGLFFVLTSLILRGKLKQRAEHTLRFITVLKIVLFSVFFGAFIELLQWKVFTYRSGDWWDLFCDALGVAMAVFSYFCLRWDKYGKAF